MTAADEDAVHEPRKAAGAALLRRATMSNGRYVAKGVPVAAGYGTTRRASGGATSTKRVRTSCSRGFAMIGHRNEDICLMYTRAPRGNLLHHG